MSEILSPPGLSYYPYQEEGILFARDRKRVLIADEMGLGKLEPVSSLIPTPSGFRKMGSLKVGDPVFGANGKKTTVTGVFPNGEMDIYRVYFRGGAYVDCGLDHLWRVKGSSFYRDGWRTFTTRDLLRMGTKTKAGHNKFKVPLQGAAEFTDTPSNAGDPYLIGALIGDGYMPKNNSWTLSIGVRDRSILDRIKTSNPDGIGPIRNRIETVLAAVVPQKKRRELEEEYSIGSELSAGKRIPEKMFTMCVESRWELMRGLMDTDGSCRNNRTAYHTISEGLAQDVKRLTHSLGGVAIIRSYDRTREGKGIELQVNVKLNECPFTVEYKKSRWKVPYKNQGPTVAIEKIEFVRREDSQCISVSAPDSLYQTGIWHTVTHNTAQAIGIINDNAYRRVLIICPASLKINWERELGMWLHDQELIIKIVGGKAVFPTRAQADIVIINYDILEKNKEWMRKEEWDMIIMDEAHYIKSSKASRTRAVVGYRELPPLDAKKIVLLTGTPMANRPSDLWTICHYLAPNVFKDAWAYRKRYCNLRYIRRFKRWDDSGASNLEELGLKMKPFMIRRFKKDVLPQLPPKTYQVHEIRAMGTLGPLITQEKKLTNFVDSSALVKVKLEDTSKIRKELGIAKAPSVIARLKDMLEQSDDKIVVFAHHREVIERIKEEFGNTCAIVYGGMSGKAKQEQIDLFKEDAGVRVFVGSITSAGVGITLTNSSTLVFAEMDYSPGNMKQAEDRIHRVGQEADMINIHYMVFENSLDANIAHRLIEKEDVIQKTIG